MIFWKVAPSQTITSIPPQSVAWSRTNESALELMILCMDTVTHKERQYTARAGSPGPQLYTELLAMSHLTLVACVVPCLTGRKHTFPFSSKKHMIFIRSIITFIQNWEQ